MKETRYSILVEDMSKCFVCGASPTHIHEVFFGTSSRKKSIEDGMCVGLCPAHHNMSSQGVHFNHELDDYLKRHSQKIWMDTYCDENDSEDEKINKFIKRYGKSFI